MEGVQTKADQYDNSALIAYMHTSAFLPLCNNKHNYILHWELTEIGKAQTTRTKTDPISPYCNF